jgi:hypothetical protein
MFVWNGLNFGKKQKFFEKKFFLLFSTAEKLLNSAPFAKQVFNEREIIRGKNSYCYKACERYKCIQWKRKDRG